MYLNVEYVHAIFYPIPLELELHTGGCEPPCGTDLWYSSRTVYVLTVEPSL